MSVKVLLFDGRIVSIRGSEPRHITALNILRRVCPEDELSAQDAEGNFVFITAGDIKDILDASGKPILRRKDDTLLTVRGKPHGEDEE